MTMRGFLACYFGAVVAVAATGVGAYQSLRDRPVPEASVPIVEAEQTPPVALPQAAPAPPAKASLPQLPKLRRHVAATPKTLAQHRPPVAPPARRPVVISSAHPDIYPSEPYHPAPPPPGRYYADPADYPYPGPYMNYPRPYGYYRPF
jgi:hypothetical protein